MALRTRLFQRWSPTFLRAASPICSLKVSPLRNRDGKLQVRHEVSVHEEGRAEAGPERDHHLETLASHDRRALHVGVVGDEARLPDGLGRGRARSKSDQAACSLGSALEPGPFSSTKCGVVRTCP